MNNKERERLLSEFLKGNNHPEAEKQFDAWFRQLNVDRQQQPDQEQLRQATDRIAARLRKGRQGAVVKPLRPGLLRFTAVAASVLLVIGLFWQTQADGYLYGLFHPVKTTVFRADNGQTRTLTLPDGSIVQLNRNSWISIDNHFGKNRRRDVILHGEAFFEVSKDKSHPFLVKASNAVVRVLGTRFNVSEDQRGNNVMVAVEEGIVTLRDQSQQAEDGLRLTAGQSAMRLSDGTVRPLSAKQIHNYFSWRTGQLNFNDTSLKDVIDQLQLIYHTPISVYEDVDAGQHLTLAYKYAPLPEVLDVICHSMGLQYTQTSKEIRIQK
ncbi:FecR family protein [Desertivirga xinjiangensis]|uniref:FecR family protein n=1 Tax=Desertivirga xinjiangensis TaxID=539206 RepID=UPI00210D9642|nr:FecR domain-containing protein [Pedobacter xinjiangensis]